MQIERPPLWNSASADSDFAAQAGSRAHDDRQCERPRDRSFPCSLFEQAQSDQAICGAHCSRSFQWRLFVVDALAMVVFSFDPLDTLSLVGGLE